jgi:hypothetical protein
MFCYVKMCCYVLLAIMCWYVRLCFTMSWYLRPCVTMCCFAWVSVTIYEDGLLCVTMCCHVWFAICNNVLVCSAMWIFVAMCCLQLSVCMCDYVFVCAAMPYSELISETLCYFVRVYVTIYEGVLLCVMMCCYVWSAICKNVLLCSAKWRCVAMCCFRICVCMCDYVFVCATMPY